LDLNYGKTYNLHSEDALFEFRPGNGFPQFVLLLIPFRRMSTHLIRHCVISAAESLHVFTGGTVVSHGEMELLIENQQSSWHQEGVHLHPDLLFNRRKGDTLKPDHRQISYNMNRPEAFGDKHWD
jgi:hypothetical protein